MPPSCASVQIAAESRQQPFLNLWLNSPDHAEVQPRSRGYLDITVTPSIRWWVASSANGRCTRRQLRASGGGGLKAPRSMECRLQDEVATAEVNLPGKLDLEVMDPITVHVAL